LHRVSFALNPTPRSVDGSPTSVTVDPGDPLFERDPLLGIEYDAGPLAYSTAKGRLHRIRDHVGEAVDQRLTIEDRLGGVASFEESTRAFSDPIHGAGEIAQEKAGPRRELSLLIADEKVKVVGHHAHGVQSELRKSQLRPGEPLENSVVELTVGPEEKAGLMAARRNEVVLARSVAS